MKKPSTRRLKNTTVSKPVRMPAVRGVPDMEGAFSESGYDIIDFGGLKVYGKCFTLFSNEGPDC